MKNLKLHEYILIILLAIYIVYPVKPTKSLAHLIDSTLGKIVVISAGIALFSLTNPVIGVLSLVVGYLLIKNSCYVTGSYYVNQLANTEEIKMEQLRKYNAHMNKTTLEEKVVNRMVPMVKHRGLGVKLKPYPSDTHNAKSLA